MNLMTRLKKIELRLEMNKPALELEDKIRKLLEIPTELRSKYRIAPKPIITLQEWEEYREEQLIKSNDKRKTEQKLKELEDKIRANDGFMEIIFTNMKLPPV